MRRVCRRSFLATAMSAAVLPAAERGDRIEAPRHEFLDGLTEREIFRLTDLDVLHHLPAAKHRFIARNNSFLLLAAEHGGTRQLYRLDLKRDRLTQVTEGPGLHPYAAHLRRNDRGFFYLQGNALVQADLNGGSRRVHYESPQGWQPTGDMDISRGERFAALVEMRADEALPSREQQVARETRCRVTVIELARSGRGRSWTAAEERRWLADPLFRPWRSQLLYRREGPWQQVRRRFQMVSLDGASKSNVRPLDGRERVECAYWSPDGSRLRYVHYPDGGRWAATIRSYQPESRVETTEAQCSAFGWFVENSDGSAMVGASRRPSGPNVYVLFPKMQREITVAEHGSTLKPYPLAGTDRLDSFAASPSPALSADSAWLYFVTDREGMPALYGMPIDDLVELTAATSG